MNKTKPTNRARLALPLQSILLILLIGGIGIQTFTSCSSDDDGGGGSNSFETVTIGDQIWMKHNLNFNVSGSKCYGEGSEVVVGYDEIGPDNMKIEIPITEPLSPDKVQENCIKYGRLYDWETAMEVCPDGWHLPSIAEWQTLVNTVGGVLIAGAKLKAASGWNGDGNGTDDYGFSALPGGYYGSHVGDIRLFFDVGDTGAWWSTDVNADGDHGRALAMSYENSRVQIGSSDNYFSVRCLQN